MEPREIFGLIVRTVGLLGALYGLWCVAFGVYGLVRPLEGEVPAKEYLVGGLFWAAAGIVLLLAAPEIVAASFR